MSKRTRRTVPGTGAVQPTATVCHGCCCGTPKVPGLDHAAQLKNLSTALDATATLQITGCLDACEQANVSVVQPSAVGRKNGGSSLWLGLVDGPDATADIAAWVKDGGAGVIDPPGILGLYAFQPSRRIRQELPDT